jgi:hypothetical protein
VEGVGVVGQPSLYPFRVSSKSVQQYTIDRPSVVCPARPPLVLSAVASGLPNAFAQFGNMREFIFEF